MAMLQSAIGSSDERVQWPKQAGACADVILSRGTRRRQSTRCFSHAAARVRHACHEQLPLHRAARGTRTNSWEHATVRPAAGNVAGEPPSVASSLSRPEAFTASFCSARGRAGVRFPRDGARVDPTGHLLCEFGEVLSLSISRAAAPSKSVWKLKKGPVGGDRARPRFPTQALSAGSGLFRVNEREFANAVSAALL
jgi:hypothetical protein